MAHKNKVEELREYMLNDYKNNRAHQHVHGTWDKEDLAIVAVDAGNNVERLDAILDALIEAELDGVKVVRSVACIGMGGLSRALLTVVAASQMGGSIDLSPLTGISPNVDDWIALTSIDGKRALIALPRPALGLVRAAAEAEDATWARIGTTGGDMLVITGDGLDGSYEHTILCFDVTELA